MTLRDLAELRDFGRWDSGPTRSPFSISPDGRFAALTLRQADPDTDAYCIGVVLVALDGSGKARLLDVGGSLVHGTNDLHGIPAIRAGTVNEATPVWAPDGLSLAYLRRDGAFTQVWLVRLDGTPARPVTDARTEVLSVAWAADGDGLLFTTRRSLDRGNAEIDREGARGFLYDERFWSLTDSRPRPRLPLASETNLLDLRTGSVRELTAQQSKALSPASPAALPPGAVQFATSSAGARAWSALADPSRPLGGEQLHLSMGGRTVACVSALCRERLSGIWWEDPKTLLVLRSGGSRNGGRMAMYRWRIGHEDEPRLLFETTDWLTGCKLSGGQMICALETPTTPRTLVRLDWRTGARVTLFDPNPGFSQHALGSVQRLVWTDAGGVPTYGDLVLPRTHKPGDRHPLVLVQYISRGFLRGGTGDEYPIFALAERGFAVLSFQMPTMLPEVEAASGVNAAQRMAVAGWAGRRRIFNALEAGVDAALSLGVVDPERIGITGMSDGSSTVQYALLHSSRFKAAAISSCCDDPSTVFSLGPGYAASAASWGYPPAGEDGRKFWSDQSLAMNAGRLRVPLLMQLPDGEYRMAAEAFAALKHAGAPAEMYVFPDEYHTKTHPAHRLAIYERNLAWFDFWLRGVVSDDPLLQSEVLRWRIMRDAVQRDAPPPASASQPQTQASTSASAMNSATAVSSLLVSSR